MFDTFERITNINTRIKYLKYTFDIPYVHIFASNSNLESTDHLQIYMIPKIYKLRDNFQYSHSVRNHLDLLSGLKPNMYCFQNRIIDMQILLERYNLVYKINLKNLIVYTQYHSYRPKAISVVIKICFSIFIFI